MSKDFPTMGTYGSDVQAMGAESPNVKFRPRGTSNPDISVGDVKGNRKGIQERMGATYAPQVGIVYPNSPEASQEFRNVRVMPSAIGNRDFYAARVAAKNNL